MGLAQLLGRSTYTASQERNSNRRGGDHSRVDSVRSPAVYRSDDRSRRGIRLPARPTRDQRSRKNRSLIAY
jgi:hypothetical protein